MSILAHDKLLARKDEIFVRGTYAESSFSGLGYQLRLADDDCLVNGIYYPPKGSASAGRGFIEIPPGQLAFLSTLEVFNLAPDLLGRFGLKFKFVRVGLVPLLTTFVEPRSRGRLYFPVLNASADKIILRPGEEIITVIFHVAPTIPDMSDLPTPEWQFLPTDVIEEHIKIRMVSTVELESQIRKIRDDIQFIQSGQERVIALAVSVIAATILGAILQTMFGLFAITQNMIPSNQTSKMLWILIPSGVYLFSVFFVVFLIAFIIKRKTHKS